MQARWIGWGLALLAQMASLGCGDDDDMQIARPTFDAGPRPRFDAGAIDAAAIDAGPLDAGAALDELGLAGERLVSELTADEAQQLCRKLDEVTTLVGNLERACKVEAYLITYAAADCSSIVMQCTANESTMLGLELELPCSKKPTEIEDCKVPLGDVLGCVVQLGEFYATRACETERLSEPLPLCPKALSVDCPALFGPPG